MKCKYFEVAVVLPWLVSIILIKVYTRWGYYYREISILQRINLQNRAVCFALTVGIGNALLLLRHVKNTNAPNRDVTLSLAYALKTPLRNTPACSRRDHPRPSTTLHPGHIRQAAT